MLSIGGVKLSLYEKTLIFVQNGIGIADHLLEVRQQISPSPPGVAECFPSVIVRLRSAVEDHAVQQTRTTDGLTLGDG